MTTPPPRQHRYTRLPADDLTSLLHVANQYKNNGVCIVTVASGRESNLSNLVNIVITGPQTKAAEADNTCTHQYIYVSSEKGHFNCAARKGRRYLAVRQRSF